MLLYRCFIFIYIFAIVYTLANCSHSIHKAPAGKKYIIKTGVDRVKTVQNHRFPEMNYQ